MIDASSIQFLVAREDAPGINTAKRGRASEVSLWEWYLPGGFVREGFTDKYFPTMDQNMLGPPWAPPASQRAPGALPRLNFYQMLTQCSSFWDFFFKKLRQSK